MPIYGRGRDTQDPRDIPRRPHGQRPEPEPRFPPWGGGVPFGPGFAFGHPGVHIAFGAGLGFMPALFGFHYVGAVWMMCLTWIDARTTAECENGGVKHSTGVFVSGDDDGRCPYSCRRVVLLSV